MAHARDAPLVFFSILAAIGAFGVAPVRRLAFTGMNDDYAIGVWKTFNVMTLTALGSSALAVGMLLPAFYLMQAIVCGFASLIIILIVACLAWKRPLDVPVLATLAKFMAWSSIVLIVARHADVVIRGRLGLAFTPDWYAVLFHGENLFVLVPALVLLNERRRHIPHVLFLGAAATAIGGLVYRFSPTTLAFRYGRASIYFPSTEELLMCVGYIGLAIALFIVAVRRFAILPDRIED